jgi:uncharacterized membrane protein
MNSWPQLSSAVLIKGWVRESFPGFQGRVAVFFTVLSVWALQLNQLENKATVDSADLSNERAIAA